MSLLCSNRILSAGRRSAVPFLLERIACPQLRQKRWLSVKELSWCASKKSRNRKVADDTTAAIIDEIREVKTPSIIIPEPISAFGIVAAMSKNRVIGWNGTIPWPRSAQDRHNFKTLTRNGIMIVGRTTYEEEPHQKHISHAQHCIVVSKTMTGSQLAASNQGAPNTNLKVVPSFPQALGLAKQILEEQEDENDGNQGDLTSELLSCWVCGGERIYEEALRHRSAQQVHLTTMHLDVDVTTDDTKSYAMFPAKHRWDQRFQKVSRVERGPNDDDPTSPAFTYVTYAR